MNVDISRLTAGMDVVGPAGEKIGEVKNVGGSDFLLDRRMRRDLHVPFSAIRELGGRSVVLDVGADAIGDQGWDPASLFGSPGEGDSAPPPEDTVVGVGDPAQRGTWSASADAYDLEALDTRAGQLATSGTDDGEPPHLAPPDPAARRSRNRTEVTETDRLRDLFG